MGKRDKAKGGRDDRSAPAPTDASAGSFHNPFADALRGLPSAPPEPTAPEPGTPAAATAEKLPRRAVVRLEKKGRRGKQVTVVSHLEGLDAPALERWCAALRHGLGCGGVVEGDTLVLQGDQRPRVAQWLAGRGVTRVTVS